MADLTPPISPIRVVGTDLFVLCKKTLDFHFLLLFFFTSSASHGPVIHHSFGVGLSGTAELASLRVA